MQNIYPTMDLEHKTRSIRPADVVVIDDQPIDNIVVKLLIKKYNQDIKVDAFEEAQTAINELFHLCKTAPAALPKYIFLDLHMKHMDGWEFLNEYKKLGIDKCKDIKIYILSSSLYKGDHLKSRSNNLISDFISKPLKMETIKEIFGTA